MPLKILPGSSNIFPTLLRVGNKLATSDNCCCDTEPPPQYSWCAGCPKDQFPPDFYLSSITVTISGFPNKWTNRDFTPIGTNFIADRYPTTIKDIDIVNATYVIPVFFGLASDPFPGNTRIDLGKWILRESVSSRPFGTQPIFDYFCGTGATMHPISNQCTRYGPTFPNWRVCGPFNGGNSRAMNECCCEYEMDVWMIMEGCGSTEWFYNLPGTGTVSLMRLQVNRELPWILRAQAWNGLGSHRFELNDVCISTGSTTVTYPMPSSSDDNFTSDRCRYCNAEGLQLVINHTITVTVTPDYTAFP